MNSQNATFEQRHEFSKLVVLHERRVGSFWKLNCVLRHYWQEVHMQFLCIWF
jgi:hypothetical protein